MCAPTAKWYSFWGECGCGRSMIAPATGEYSSRGELGMRAINEAHCVCAPATRGDSLGMDVECELFIAPFDVKHLDRDAAELAFAVVVDAKGFVPREGGAAEVARHAFVVQVVEIVSGGQRAF